MATATPPTPLPPPSTFDILPPLHPVLARLLLPSPSDTPPDAPPPLAAKDLATAASSITARIQRARTVVAALDGVDMSVAEQEDVIRELEAEVGRGRGVLEGIGRSVRVEGEGEKGRGQDAEIGGAEGNECQM